MMDMTPVEARVVPLNPCDWPELYRLMVARRFPSTPPKYVDAEPFFRTAHVFGMRGQGGLLAGFVFGEPQDGIGFVDIVCRVSEQGRWATKPVLRELLRLAFLPEPQGLGLRCLWVQPHHPKALKAALKAGFVPVTPLDGEAPILAMTPHSAPPKLMNKE